MKVYFFRQREQEHNFCSFFVQKVDRGRRRVYNNFVTFL